MRIAAFTDIHSAGTCLADALREARAEGFDTLLILGDLLTYGPEPAETLDLVAEAIARDNAILITGNHDAIYLDMAGADVDAGAGASYRLALPDWLRETIDWTAARIPSGVMQRFDWRQSWSHGSLFAAHANPGAFGDWGYITDDASADVAAAALAARGYRHGIFGHTHRARRFERGGQSLFTLGALGQPRDDADRRPRWTMIELGEDRIELHPRPLPFDRDAHLAAIRATSMSAATQDRLCGFFA